MTIKQQGGIFGRNPSYNEVDANELNVDNIKIDGNNITSTNTNGDIAISPDGTGSLIIGNNGQADYVAAKIRKKFNGYVSVQFDGGGADPYADLRMDFSENLALRLDPNNNLADQTFSITHNGSDFAQFIGSSGNLLLNTGNLVIGTSGQGIDFSATSGTGTSELFSDYEEGNWTPTVNVGTATAEYANYTKIGRQVTVSAYLHTFSDTSTATNVQIGGLPFTSSSNNRTAGSMFGRNIAAGTGVIQNSPYIASSATTINLFGVYTGSFDPIQFADFDGSTQLYVTVSYIT